MFPRTSFAWGERLGVLVRTTDVPAVEAEARRDRGEEGEVRARQAMGDEWSLAVASRVTVVEVTVCKETVP